MTTIKFAGAVLGALALLASPAAAQTVGGTAFGTYVNALGVTARSPVATLPSSGGMAVGDAGSFGVPNAVDARWLMAITTGAVDNPTSSAQSSSELEQVNVLAGVITADVVTAIASSYRTAGGAASDANGSGFVNLVVNGVTLATDVAPNTQIDLPGVGYVVLNEQTRVGNGVSSSGITVNMIHVYLQGVSLLGVVTTTGEIIVGSANSAVGG
jgi:hypothetical protein